MKVNSGAFGELSLAMSYSLKEIDSLRSVCIFMYMLCLSDFGGNAHRGTR